MPDPELRHLRAPDPDAPRRRDVMSAGRVLAVVVLTLVLAALFNAGRQQERASQQPLGPDRDRALALWGPTDAATDAIGLQGPRHLFDAIRAGGDPDPDVVVGDDRPPSTDEVVPGGDSLPSTGLPESAEAPDSTVPATTLPPETAPTTTTTAPPRMASLDAPLRVSLIGDSTMDGPGRALQRLLADTGVAVSDLDSRPSSGFSRPDFFDWSAHLATVIPERDPEVVIAMFGGNDAQGFVVDGTVYEFGTAEWIGEYRRRVREAMELMVADGRRVIWIGQPDMRSEGFDAKIDIVNQIYIDQAAAVDGVEFFDSRPILTPDGYRAFGPGADGSEKRLRSDDGIHLTIDGGDVVGSAVLQELIARGFLPVSP